MALVKLHGSVDCIGTQRVMTTLVEGQVEFQFLPVHPNATHTREFLSLNPFGEIPVVEDGDLTLFDSRTAMRYISFEYGMEVGQRASIHQGVVAMWVDVEKHHFQEPAHRLIQGLDSTAAAEDDERRLGRVLDVYERRLQASKFLGWDDFTSADLTHMPCLHALMQTSRGKRLLLHDARPHVATWCTSLLSRPSWARVQEMLATYSKPDLHLFDGIDEGKIMSF